MFVKISNFEADWRNEAAATQKIFDALTDASLAQQIAPKHRTIGQVAWHIVNTIPEMLTLTGLRFDCPGDSVAVPATAADIAAAYRQTSDAMLAAIRSQWTDESLLRQSNMYGELWPNGLTLWILVKHEIHHCGQITVLMRQAGLRVPGIYGPVMEEWAERGMVLPPV
jgi:uncharacterized damage-inducible protein DinB